MKRRLIALLVLTGFRIFAQAQTSTATTFTTTFDTRLDTTSDGLEIQFEGRGEHYTVSISGGDTSFYQTLSDVNNAAYIQVPKAGTYTVVASNGACEFYGYSNWGGGSGSTDGRDMLVNISQWGHFKFRTLVFQAAHNLDITATDVPDLRAIYNFQWGFAYCYNLKGNPSMGRWDVSHVQTFNQMFIGCTHFDQDLSGWKISSAQDLAQAFAYTALSKCHYDKMLHAWANDLTTPDKVFATNQNELTYSDSVSHNYLVNVKHWRLEDDKYVSGSCSVSAVTYAATSAGISNGQLNVNWETTSEMNTDHFEIETSTDSGATYSKLGDVASKATDGNSGSTLQYTYSAATSNIQNASAIFLLLFMLVFLGFQKRGKQLAAVFLLSGVMFTVACKKGHEADPKPPVTIDKTVYVRITQVDKYGVRTSSDKILAEKK